MSDMEIIFAENNHTIVKIGGRQYEIFRTYNNGVCIINDVGERLKIEWKIS